MTGEPGSSAVQFNSHDLPSWNIIPYNSTSACYDDIQTSSVTEVTTFRVSRRRREMYIGYARLRVCLSVCLSLAAFPHYCTDADVTWGNGRGAPSCALLGDLQSVHVFRCYDNIASNAKCRQMSR